MKIAVLGDGGWGTTLAIYLDGIGHRVILWGVFADYAADVARRRENTKFLPGVRIPRSIRITGDLALAMDSAELTVLAVPAQHLAAVLKRVRSHSTSVRSFLNVAKGIECGTHRLMSTVIRDALGPVRIAVLSGPNIASEIARGRPASSVLAATDRGFREALQAAFISDRLRIYTSNDLIGIQLGGALKNPIAIAAGIGDGLRLGSNAKAALMTRGVVEMARLGVVMGARRETFWGLSGLGDLVTTCLSGRNHRLGVQLGEGRSLRAVLGATPMVIEGVQTAKAAVGLARRYRVELPIIEQVHAILFHRRPPHRALEALMRRAGKAELA